MPNDKATALAAQFKAQAEKAMTEQWTREVSLPVPSIAPDFVFTFIARRVDATSMLYAGELPEHFTRLILGDADDVAEGAEPRKVSADEKRAALEFQIKIAQEVCMAPRLVFADPKDETEVDLRKLPFSGNLILALFNYAMNLSPDVPVATTEGGSTSLAAVETFPAGGGGAQLSGAGDVGANVGAVAGG